ncbi:helix-turn-helix domain-containing protein [Peribacillus sp. Hz7]|uniref:helix-turn-helix domain-containing protein n=1 Tax=Peribacillus sp. Hz7 TaxID=3344873 RepID=UPI0035CAD88A
MKELFNDVDTSTQRDLPTRWLSKIKDFSVLCIYEQEKAAEDNIILRKKKVRGTLIDIPIFNDRRDARTFVIWDLAYQESEDLFINLRFAARNRMISQIAENIVTHLIIKYEDNQRFSSKRQSILKDKSIMEQAIKQFENVLKKETFLVNNDVWDEFCSWFKIRLTSWVLVEMEKSIGVHRMDELNEKELNELFYKILTTNLEKDTKFLSGFTQIVNDYSRNWMRNIITSMNIEDWSMQKIEMILHLKVDSLQSTSSLLPSRKDFSYSLIDQGNLLVMNNAPYQSVREALYKRRFESCDNSPWPTVQINKGNIEGCVQIKPYTFMMKEQEAEDILVAEAWRQAKEISDLDVDLFDALCSIFLLKARYHEDIVEIQLDDLLSIRGLKPKLGGEGRRGGYEMKQREQVVKSLTKIQSLWIELEKAIIYEKGKPVQVKLQGRTFIFKNQKKLEYEVAKQANEKKLMFTVDKVFAKYLYGSGRQVALLPTKALQYNPYRQTWEKRLTRYFSWRWRTQARKGDYQQPNKICTLLDSIGENMNKRIPSRTRDRLEKALDTLVEDGVITAWHYEKWEESIASNKGWARIWMNSTIVVKPPDVIIEQYRPIQRNRKVQNKPLNQPTVFSRHEEVMDLGDRIRNLRKKLKLSLLQIAEELEISASYLSHIERCIKVPSNKIEKRIINWLNRHEDII